MHTQRLMRAARLFAVLGFLPSCADQAGGEPSDPSDEVVAPSSAEALDDGPVVGLTDVSALLRGDGAEFELPSRAEDDPQGASAQSAAQASLTDLNRNGPHRAGSYRSGFRDGPDFRAATIFFPTDVDADLAGVVMCPGFTATQSSIAPWGPFFASHGVVLMTIDTNSVNDPVPVRARALLDALTSLKAEDARAGSPLAGKLSADKFGLAGWSMGGGGTWIAAAETPSLKTAVTLAGHNLSAGGPRIARGSVVPTLMMNGAADTTILGGRGQSSGAFDEIANDTPKMLYEMRGLGHFVWGTPRTNGGASGRYMMAWQKVFLEGDEQFLAILRERGPNATVFRSNIE